MSPEQLTAIRTALGLTQEELAEVLCVNRLTIGGFETGKRVPNATLTMLVPASSNRDGDPARYASSQGACTTRNEAALHQDERAPWRGSSSCSSPPPSHWASRSHCPSPTSTTGRQGTPHISSSPQKPREPRRKSPARDNHHRRVGGHHRHVDAAHPAPRRRGPDPARAALSGRQGGPRHPQRGGAPRRRAAALRKPQSPRPDLRDRQPAATCFSSTTTTVTSVSAKPSTSNSTSSPNGETSMTTFRHHHTAVRASRSLHSCSPPPPRRSPPARSRRRTSTRPAQDLISEIHVLRDEMGVQDYPPEAEPQEDRAPGARLRPNRSRSRPRSQGRNAGSACRPAG